MLGWIILAYPLALILGIIIGAIAARYLEGLAWASAIGAAIAAILAQGSLEIMLPASALCAALGFVGAGVSVLIRVLLAKLKS